VVMALQVKVKYENFKDLRDNRINQILHYRNLQIATLFTTRLLLYMNHIIIGFSFVPSLSSFPNYASMPKWLSNSEKIRLEIFIVQGVKELVFP